MTYSLTHSGLIVAMGGLVLVNVLGFTDNCSSEITAKAVEFAPVLVGSVMAWIGRMRASGPTTLGGFKERSFG